MFSKKAFKRGFCQIASGPYVYRGRPVNSDLENMKKDWIKVGGYIRKAIEEYGKSERR